MAEALSEISARYTNPVYDRSFPDPFVLKHRGGYFAYCTGQGSDGRVFGVLRSRDLVNWTEAGGAMDPLAEPHPHYWAPEVTYYNGTFYMYYSVGNETLMEIRVATGQSPLGPFTDSGRRLTSEEFAIDPHIVRDTGGQWFMFYATDFLDHSHIGTGTVVDRMIDPFTLKGKPRPVTRARYDWQVYDPARKEKGGVRWHTVEGPFVINRKGVYYEMFSGGNWQNDTYGVSFAVSEAIESDEEWSQYSDGNSTLPVLRTLPGKIVGPGHNSVVRGPNNRELYCVYHRWHQDARKLAIDRMDFAGGNRLFVAGPTDTPQPYPHSPLHLTDFDDLDHDLWQVLSGDWHDANRTLTCGGTELDEIIFETGRESDYHCEISLREVVDSGPFGICLKAAEVDVFRFEIDPAQNVAWTEWPGSGGRRTLQLPRDFNARAVHEFTLDVEHESVCIALGGSDLLLNANLPAKPSAFGLYSKGSIIQFGPIDLTYGFEELFQGGDIWMRGWDHYANLGTLKMADGLLTIEGNREGNAVLRRNVQRGNFELCFNLRLTETTGPNARLTFGCGNFFTLSFAPELKLEAEGLSCSLPEHYDPTNFSQFRIMRVGERVDIFLEAVHLCTLPADDGEYVRISAQDVRAEVEMIRYTILE